MQTLSNQVVFMQHINCAIGLDNNSTSLIKNFNDPLVAGVNYASYPFVASPEYKVLDPYTVSTAMFTNLNSVHCGGFTTCFPLPVGCGGLASAYTGFAKIQDTTLAIMANTTAQYGYNETLCIACENAGGSRITHDNF